jgi:hypothetical protein
LIYGIPIRHGIYERERTCIIGVNIPIIFFTIVMISLLCIVVGVVVFKSRKWLSILLFSLPVLIIAVPIGFFYYAYHASSPESVTLNIKESGPSAYLLEGEWNSRADFYSYGKDVIVFCLASQNGTLEVDLPSVEQLNDGILKLGVERLRSEQRDANSYCSSYMVDQQEIYSIPYKLHNVAPGELEIFYIHTVIEPMDSPTYWFKKLDFERM